MAKRGAVARALDAFAVAEGFWLTGDCTGGPHGGSGGPGSPTSPDYCPAEVDFTLQSPDVWFWKEGTALKSLDTLSGPMQLSDEDLGDGPRAALRRDRSSGKLYLERNLTPNPLLRSIWP